MAKQRYHRLPDWKRGYVEMSHGSGGRAMTQLIETLFMEQFDNELLRAQNDSACFDTPAGRMVMTTDSHVVSPLFFPGGDIGCLSVHGTVNDIAMAGGQPQYLAASFIIEEGFPLADLRRIVESMAQAAREAGVLIITGDTKVVERGKGDGIFITTTGIGTVLPGINVSGANIRPGDRIIVSGTLGDHSVAIMSLRENLSFDTVMQSDTAALHGLVAVMLKAVPGIRALRDPTRGGLAAVMNEFAQKSGVGILLQEEALPVKPQTRAVCELLGLDPLYVANEGKLIAVCDADDAERLLAVMRAHPLGHNAALIGSAIEDARCFVQMETALGGRRMVDWLTGEQLPRIC
jgi:hydrogenase expression/formation protein HypE